MVSGKHPDDAWPQRLLLPCGQIAVPYAGVVQTSENRDRALQGRLRLILVRFRHFEVRSNGGQKRVHQLRVFENVSRCAAQPAQLFNQLEVR